VSENGHVNIHGEGRFLSHSFNPNLVVRIHECSSHPIDFVARRDIAEVTLEHIIHRYVRKENGAYTTPPRLGFLKKAIEIRN